MYYLDADLLAFRSVEAVEHSAEVGTRDDPLDAVSVDDPVADDNWIVAGLLVPSFVRVVYKRHHHARKVFQACFKFKVRLVVDDLSLVVGSCIRLADFYVLIDLSERKRSVVPLIVTKTKVPGRSKLGPYLVRKYNRVTHRVLKAILQALLQPSVLILKLFSLNCIAFDKLP